MIRRRDFLALAGAATALPRVAFGQQSKIPRIAYLSITISQVTWDAVVRGLAEAGYVDGKTMTLERFTAATNSDLPTVAARALATNPDVLMTQGTPTTLVAKSLTTTVPILFSAGAPVELGLVTSLAHPGGNVTGVTNTSVDLPGKQLGLLKETLPMMQRVAILNLPVDPAVQSAADAAAGAARTLGIEPVVVDFVEGIDFAEQFQRVTSAGVDAVYLPGSNYMNANRDVLFDLELKTRLPMLWTTTAQPFNGVLGYGANSANQFRRWGAMVAYVLKGIKPADIPVEQPTVYDFVVNVKTAKSIGVTIPPSIFAQATAVIE